MTISVPDTRQYPLVAYVAFAVGDLVSAAASKLFELPLGAIITAGQYNLDAAFDSGTSDVVIIGDVTTADRYFTDANAKDAVAAGSQWVATGYAAVAADTPVNITWTGAGTAATVGSGRIIAEYIVPTRAQENYE